MKTPPFALWIWYRGDHFRGFQRQVEGPTVQAALQEAIAAIGAEATPVPSGRTDRGVHARMQVVSFRPRGGPQEVNLFVQALSARLPPGVGIAAAARALPAFHAQWSATEKEYRYRLQLEGTPSPDWAPFVWQPPGARVDPARLQALLRRMEGTRDFIAFHEKSSVQRPRTIFSATLRDLGEGRCEAILRGDGFARYQVRYLVGSTVATAAGLLPEEKLAAALEHGEGIAGTKAPAQGLVLWSVGYPPAIDPFVEARSGGAVLPDEPPF